ncbi:MAG: hypothetical protein O4804_03935 [Trichodesmium sp. St11_bin5]|nr:hypothetical protein [Trichodesmium sp. St11_bin5]
MLTTNFIHLAIEPVTTTMAIMFLGKALGVCGAGVGGGTLGNALSQKFKNKKKKIDWGKAVSKGTTVATSGISLVSRLDGVISPQNPQDENKPSK